MHASNGSVTDHLILLLHLRALGWCSQAAWPQSYHFADVERLGAFQMAHLRALGIKDPQNWPQAKIAATEQGWNVSHLLLMSSQL